MGKTVKPMYVHCMTEVLEIGESDFISRLLDIDKQMHFLFYFKLYLI